MTSLEDLKHAGEAPPWMTDEGYKVLTGGYLLTDETPRAMYQRVAKAAAKHGKRAKHWAEKYFDAMWSNWLCPASPVLSNMGTTRGLPISCDTVHLDDSVDSIFSKVHEVAMLSKNGAGVGIYVGDVRARGLAIKGNGQSEGVIPWLKIYDSTIVAISQGSVRRGSGAVYLPIEHGDSDEFINIRRPTGDANRRCLNLNHAVTITDAWMKSMVGGDKAKRTLWQDLLRTRVETGEPYILFLDNVNNQNPSCYSTNNLRVVSSNLCSEIVLHTDPEHSFVCCLSSLNLARWNEWRDTDVVQTSIRFLDGVMQEYIDRAEGVSGLDATRRFAEKSRALGLGVLGWHTLLQDLRYPFESLQAMMLNAQVFKWIRAEAEFATAELAEELGEPEWCVGHKRRNTHLLAVAPTVSNSAISGGVSAGIEPIAANVYAVKSARGTFIRKNPTLVSVLEACGKNDEGTWKSILEQSGSVQHLPFLTDNGRAVFLTARELNQHSLVKQAAQRQQWIDQAQSLNLFFATNASPKYIHEVHLAAWQLGVKSLYYLRTEGVLRGDMASRSADECLACEA